MVLPLGYFFVNMVHHRFSAVINGKAAMKFSIYLDSYVKGLLTIGQMLEQLGSGSIHILPGLVESGCDRLGVHQATKIGTADWPKMPITLFDMVISIPVQKQISLAHQQRALEREIVKARTGTDGAESSF